MAVMPKWQKRRRGDGRADGGGADSSSANYQLTPEHGDEPRARGGDPEGEEDAELHATIDCERMSIARAMDSNSKQQ